MRLGLPNGTLMGALEVSEAAQSSFTNGRIFVVAAASRSFDPPEKATLSGRLLEKSPCERYRICHRTFVRSLCDEHAPCRSSGVGREARHAMRRPPVLTEGIVADVHTRISANLEHPSPDPHGRRSGSLCEEKAGAAVQARPAGDRLRRRGRPTCLRCRRIDVVIVAEFVEAHLGGAVK